MQRTKGPDPLSDAPGPIDPSTLHAFLLEQNKVFTVTADRSSTLYHSRQWLTFTGLTPEQLGTLTWPGLDPEDGSNTADLWDPSFESGQPFEVEQRFRRFDGIYRRHLVRVHPVRSADGELLFLDRELPGHRRSDDLGTVPSPKPATGCRRTARSLYRT
jgi:PAS domain-containing protein